MPQLMAGFAQADITPPVGVGMAGYGARVKPSESIKDPLLAEVLVLSSGEQTVALVCLDNIGLNCDMVRPVRERAAAASGIPEGQIMVCSSHSHWGPLTSGARYLPEYLRDTMSPQYNEQLIIAVAGAVAQARQAAEPVRAAYGSGFADLTTFNRRCVAPDFTDVWLAAMEPPRALLASRVGNELARQWRKGQHKGPRLSEPLDVIDGNRVGPADAQVGLLRLQRPDGTPLAGLVNFACHAVCGGDDDMYAISPDWPGHARSAFAALIGAPMLYAAGCSGDQVPRWRRGDSRHRVGSSVGAEAARVWWGLDETHEDLPLRAVRETAYLPVNPRLLPLAEARAALAAKPDPEGPDAVWERCMVGMAEEVEGMDHGYPAEIWALRLGDLGLVGLPGEILTEIGMQIKQRSPFAHTMVVSLANGSIGYLPTDDAVAEGGYEPEWSPTGPGTERMLVETGLKLLEELSR